MISAIIHAIEKARTVEPVNNLVIENSTASEKNEFLFFIKPEITVENNAIQLKEILTMALDKIAAHSLKIMNVKVVNAAYLEKHQIIAAHYGVINRISSSVKTAISQEGKARFESLYNISFNEAPVYGSIEFLKEFPHFSPTGLSFLWQNSPTEKLAGGTYVQKLSLDGKPVFLVNGFHPRQLEHFVAPERTIVCMTLTGETSWKDARNKLIGKTNPADAEPGSIRRTLLDEKEAFGLSEVSSSWNGVHLSAGPLEGLAELIRYNSDFGNGKILEVDNFSFGRKLISNFGVETARQLLNNMNFIQNDKTVSAFDLTEELDSDECIRTLKQWI